MSVEKNSIDTQINCRRLEDDEAKMHNKPFFSPKSGRNIGMNEAAKKMIRCEMKLNAYANVRAFWTRSLPERQGMWTQSANTARKNRKQRDKFAVQQQRAIYVTAPKQIEHF